MKIFRWSKNRVIGYLIFSLFFSLLLNLGNDFDVNILKLLQTWITYWVLPATIYQIIVFEEIK